jgi:hypothetical protein
MANLLTFRYQDMAKNQSETDPGNRQSPSSYDFIQLGMETWQRVKLSFPPSIISICEPIEFEDLLFLIY